MKKWDALESDTSPRVLITYGKYGKQVFDATGAKLWSVSLHLVQERNKTTFYWTDFAETIRESSQIYERDLNRLEILKEHGDKFSSEIASLQAQVDGRLRFQEKMRDFKYYLNMALQGNDGRYAFEFLELRSDYEYEKIELVSLSQIGEEILW